jgi:hypothetical protein
MKEKPSKLQILNYKLAIISSIVIIVNIMFKWYQNQYPNLAVNVPMYIYKIQDAINITDLLAITIFILTVIFAVTSFVGVNVFGVNAKMNFKVIGIVIIIGMVYFIFRSSYIMITIDKHMYSEDRAKVASMVASGEIGNSDKYEIIELPAEYKKVSRDHGKIIIRREDGNTWVYFTTYRGLVSDERNTFVYCKEDSEKLLVDASGYIYEEKKLKAHWFWAVVR